MTQWISDADRVLIFNASGELGVTIGLNSHTLKEFETLLVENDGNSLQYNLVTQPKSDFCLIELFAK